MEVKNTMKVAITAKRVVMLMMTMAVAGAMVACQAAVKSAATIAKEIGDIEYDVGDSATKITLTGYFKVTKPTYSATSSKKSVAAVSVSGAVLTVTPGVAGNANVTVTAKGDEGSVSQTFNVTVKAPTPIVNKPPTVRTIPDKTLKVGTTETLDLSRYAEDPEGVALMYAAESSNEAVAEVSVANGALTIAAGVVPGTATITVTVSDGTNSPVAREFDVTVTTDTPDPNKPPTIGTIIDRTLKVGDTRDISLSIYANDPEGDALTYNATSDDPAVTTVSVANDVLTITAVADGTATITVTVDDGTNSPVAREFNVTVNPVTPENERPEQELIDDIDDMRRGGTRELDLSSYYDDPDGDPLTYEATSSDEMVVTVSVSGSMLTITGVGVGTARISVTVSDDTDEVRQTFTVTVGSQPPMATTTLPTNIPLGLAGSTQDIDLSLYFSDPEGDDLTYTAMSDNTAVAKVSDPDADGMITITAVAPKSKTEVGTATITVTAKDADNAAVSLDFFVFVTVDPMDVDNTAPAVRGIEDMVLKTGDQSTLDLGMHFIDPGDELSYEATSIMEMYVTVAVDGSMLTITAVDEGTARITVKATDSYGAAATAFFMVTVTPQNVVPVAIGIPDQSLEMDFHTMKTLDLSMYFSDSDGPNDLTYTASSSMDTYATAMVDGSTLMIKAVAAGMAPITVTALDGEDSVVDMFTVTVSNPAVPTATSELPDQNFAHGDMEAQMFTLSDHFRRATDYAVSVSGDGVVMAEEEGGVLTLTPVGAGNVVVTVKPSNSGGFGASQSINVIVADEPEELMLPPRPVGTIAAQMVDIGATGTVDVSGNFIEPEGEQLTYAAASSDEGVATAKVSEAGVVSIIGVAAGPATITVTVTDTDELTAAQTIQVTVPDEEILPPRYVGSLPGSVALKPGQQYVISGTDIESSFVEDEDESLTFSFSEDDPSSIVQVGQADDGTVTITALAAVGDATVTIIATDTDEEMATHEIAVAVRTSLQPEASGTPDPVALDVGGDAKPVDVSGYFSDPGVGDVTYAAVSDTGSVATAAAVGSMVTITPKGAGNAMVTVTATNSYGTASQMIRVTVAATPPMARGTILDQILTIGQTTTVGLAEYFTAGAGGGPITSYDRSVTGDVNAVSATIFGEILRIDAHAEGSAIITVTATDADGETVDQTINVTVERAAAIPTVIKNIADQTFEHDEGAKNLMLSDHFSGAASYVATQTPQGVVDTEVSDQVLTITPVDAGSTVVTVTASNAAGMRALEFNVVVDEAPKGPELESEMEFSDLRISVGAANRRPLDLDALITDPDGIDENLQFRTVTDGSDTVGVFEDDRTDRTTDIAGVIAPVDMKATTARYVIIHPVAVGETTITVTATDEDGNSESFKFEVMVIATANDPVGAQGALVVAASEPHGDNRFKSTDRTPKVVTADDALVTTFFTDDDLDRLDDPDELKFEVMYIALEGNGTVAVPADLDEVDELDEAKVVADVDITPDTWSGSNRTKISITVTPEKSGAPHGVLIVATDLSGAKAAHAFRVQVNRPPVAYSGGGDDRKSLLTEDSYMELSSGFATTSAEALVDDPATVDNPATPAVENAEGYFSDEDGDALMCRLVSRTGESATFAFGDADRDSFTLAGVGTPAEPKTGVSTFEVRCFDQVGGTEMESVDDTLTVDVKYLLSIQ